jgi:predicted O-methyltransferase YrrM
VDTETKGISDAIDLLNQLFDMPAPRLAKCRTLYRLARLSKGMIVELGTYHGNGYIALCLGASPDQKVVTVDDYKPKKGWTGEKYIPEDMEIFYDRCSKAGIDAPALIHASFTEATVNWEADIGLLFWDAGQDRLIETIYYWEPFIAPGGIMAIHDTYGHLFGAKDYVSKLVKTGKYCQYKVMGGGVHVARKAQSE